MVILVAAGLSKTAFAVLLKLSHGLTQRWPTAGFAASAQISFGLLTVALRELEAGSAYATWTGIGAAGAAAVGMVFFGDAVPAGKLVSIGLVLAGVIEGYERTVDSHVKNLRRRIEDDPANPRIVQTVLGGGYRLGLAHGD